MIIKEDHSDIKQSNNVSFNVIFIRFFPTFIEGVQRSGSFEERCFGEHDRNKTPKRKLNACSELFRQASNKNLLSRVASPTSSDWSGADERKIC